jgi:hypothetical protein
MTDSAPASQRSVDPTPRWEPAHPLFALGWGVLLSFVGLWMASDQGPLPLAWACVALGLALLATGAVAKGVAWGLALHGRTHR